MFVHEVIDHGRGVIPGSPGRRPQQASLCHLFFDDEAAAKAYIGRYHPSRQREMQYIAREWGQPALSVLWIEDHRTR